MPAAAPADRRDVKKKKKRKPKVEPPFEQVVADPSRRLDRTYVVGKRIGKCVLCFVWVSMELWSVYEGV